jgi:hypothetical protein
MSNTLAENGSIATLKGNGQGVDKKSLNPQGRGSSKLSIANTGGNTMDKLAEALTQGARGLQHQRNDSSTLKRAQLSILHIFLIFALPSSPKRA